MNDTPTSLPISFFFKFVGVRSKDVNVIGCNMELPL